MLEHLRLYVKGNCVITPHTDHACPTQTDVLARLANQVVFTTVKHTTTMYGCLARQGGSARPQMSSKSVTVAGGLGAADIQMSEPSWRRHRLLRQTSDAGPAQAEAAHQDDGRLRQTAEMDAL
jgi:hypothetical protein